MPPEFEPIFARLREILQKYSARLSVKEDTARRYCLECGLHAKRKEPMPIAWVEINKA